MNAFLYQNREYSTRSGRLKEMQQLEDQQHQQLEETQLFQEIQLLEVLVQTMWLVLKNMLMLHAFLKFLWMKKKKEILITI